jgi:hypothetical protein
MYSAKKIRDNPRKSVAKGFAVAFICLFSLRSFAQERDVVSDCVTTSFTGSVKRGLPFVQTIGSGLTYQLVPVESQASEHKGEPQFIGWTIRIAYLKNRGEMEREFSEVMTPLSNGENPRSLGRSTSDLWADHTVHFPLNQLDYATLGRLRAEILSDSSNSGTQSAEHEMQKISFGSAKFNVVGVPGGFASGVPGRPELDKAGVLDMNFKVDLIVPKSLKLAPELAIKAKPSPCPVAPISLRSDK